MRTVDAAIARVRAFARRQKWTAYRYSVEAKVPASTIRDLHREEWSPSVETLRKLEDVIPPDFLAPCNGPKRPNGNGNGRRPNSGK